MGSFLPGGQLVPDCGPCGCGFAEFVQLFQNIIAGAIWLGVIIITIVIAYAGFKLVMSAAKPGERSEALSMLRMSGIGFVVVLGAFLLVDTALSAVLSDERLGGKTWSQLIGGGTAPDCTRFSETGAGLGEFTYTDPYSGGRTASWYFTNSEATRINAIFRAGEAVGLANIVYEVASPEERTQLLEQLEEATGATSYPANRVISVPGITAPHFSVYLTNGSATTPTCVGANSTACPTLTGANYGLTCKESRSCKAVQALAQKLKAMKERTETPAFRVTEAYPKTRDHESACHDHGTCVDINFPQ